MTTLYTQKLTITLGQKTICRDLDLIINPGDIWGILGPNGCGKTTLLHTLAGLHAPTEGRIFLNQDNIAHLSPKILAQTIGLLFQETNPVLPQTVWDYCLLARFPHLSYFTKESAEDKNIVIQALGQMELSALKGRLLSQLSGGEKKRLGIAALLAQTPEFYFLDEPTNHLDIRHQLAVLTHFTQLAQTKAMVMSLHDINQAARYCNRILLMFPDGATLQGTPRQMLTAAHLSQLYQCPIEHQQGTYWLPQNP